LRRGDGDKGLILSNQRHSNRCKSAQNRPSNIKLLAHELVEAKVLECGTYLRKKTGLGAHPSLSGRFNLKLAEAQHWVAAGRGGLLLRLLQRDEPVPARSSSGLRRCRRDGGSGTCICLMGCQPCLRKLGRAGLSVARRERLAAEVLGAKRQSGDLDLPQLH
jgi:hypothetical protein